MWNLVKFEGFSCLICFLICFKLFIKFINILVRFGVIRLFYLDVNFSKKI